MKMQIARDKSRWFSRLDSRFVARRNCCTPGSNPATTRAATAIRAGPGHQRHDGQPLARPAGRSGAGNTTAACSGKPADRPRLQHNCRSARVSSFDSHHGTPGNGDCRECSRERRWSFASGWNGNCRRQAAPDALAVFEIGAVAAAGIADRNRGRACRKERPAPHRAARVLLLALS